MNIEQKAKAYDKALDDIRAIYPNLKGDAKLAVEHAFPELAESDDERIRKNILTKMRACQKQSNFFSNNEIAWLEKQKDSKVVKFDHDREQKPAEWSDEDYNALNYVHELISFGYTENFFDAQTAADMRSWLNSHITSWKPSEEQIDALERASTNKYLSAKQFDILVSLYEQLKKL